MNFWNTHPLLAFQKKNSFSKIFGKHLFWSPLFVCERLLALKGSHPFWICKRIMPTLTNRRECEIVVVVGKNIKTNSPGDNNSRKVGKNWKFQWLRGWLLNCFSLSFSNLENRSIKNSCVCSKSKKQKKVTSKQNLEYFKIINQRLFIPKFCNNSKCCCHPPGQYL